jgi:hypothetical protein
LINSKHLISDETKSRTASGNGCFYSMRQTFRSRAMSKVDKIKIFKTKVKPVAVYGSETWAMTEIDMKRLTTGERNII